MFLIILIFSIILQYFCRKLENRRNLELWHGIGTKAAPKDLLLNRHIFEILEIAIL